LRPFFFSHVGIYALSLPPCISLMVSHKYYCVVLSFSIVQNLLYNSLFESFLEICLVLEFCDITFFHIRSLFNLLYWISILLCICFVLTKNEKRSFPICITNYPFYTVCSFKRSGKITNTEARKHISNENVTILG